MTWTVAKKELRGYFNSAVAVIFLAAFLAVTFYTFFWREKFFARGIADLRPLFEWMPKLLVIIVSALAMRLWADERKAGTLEVLLTLPVPRWQLVIGKFVAGMALIAVALLLTFGLPITISHLGKLDWGPVWGGYLAALMLSAASLAIGMCVSAATDNQIVAFVGTAILCGVAYALGGDGTSELGRALGTGTRFESVARGVLDLRDLAYYGSIVVIGIALNVLLLGRLTWSRGPRAHNRRVGAILGVVLIAANAIALDVWLSPIRRARIDLTRDSEFSLSPSTEKILSNLDERLLIRGYFSDKTHPQLAPLIPQLRDLLDEYRVAGGDKVRVEFIDPTDNPDAKREAKERFDINPTPLRFATTTEKSVIDAYFSIAIEYGDQHTVLGIDDLIQVRVVDINNAEITLKNPEYQLTKTIKKTIASFSSVDSLFASMPDKVQLTAYITPKTLPDNWKDAPATLTKVVDGLVKQSAGKLKYTTVEPKTDDEMKDLYQRYGLRPYSEILTGNVYYFQLLLQVGNRLVRITPPEQLGEAALKSAITDGLKRAAPGFTHVVGLWSPPGGQGMPMMEGMPPQQQPPPQQFRLLERALSGTYEVRPVTLDQPVPDDIEVLVLGGPANLDAKAVENVDQFVMRGGGLVALDGRFRLAPANGLGVEKVTTGLEAELAKWGVTVDDKMVMDTKNDSFPVPQNKDIGNGMMVREIQQKPYALFVKVDGSGLSDDSVITNGLSGSVMQWVSPITAQAKVGDDEHHVEPLLTTSDSAWLSSSTNVEPDWEKYEKAGFPVTGDQARRVLAVAITGGFASGLAKPTDPKARWIQHSPPDTRIAVFGSSAFVSDDMLQFAQQLDSDFAASNLELVHNTIDWALADTDLLAIRSHNSAGHALTVDVDARESWRDVNLAIGFILLAAVVGLAWLRRRAVRPVVEVA
ncbi:MAG TPA: Gldg family protein [Kofleriaceae bacterium]|nr:Gldg family protein [Kofleriaceae bacterium]